MVEIELASLGRAALYLGVPFIIMTYVLQWKWAKICDRNIQVLVAQRGGGGRYFLSPKEGGEVSITNPETDETRVWPVNELSTIDITYPGVGFIPRFLQKNIRLAIVNEGDWEPMLNRSPHRKKVASPDVIAFLQNIAKMYPKSAEQVEEFLKGISSGTTREMVADPAALGNLMRNGVMKALASVSNDLLEQLKIINSRLTRIVTINPTIVYVGLGLIAILCAVTIYYVVRIAPSLEQAGTMSDKLDSIQKALGVTP